MGNLYFITENSGLITNVDSSNNNLIKTEFIISHQVVFKSAPEDWRMLGGVENPEEDSVVKEGDENTFFYQFWYDEVRGRFEDIPFEARPENDTGLKHCPSCIRVAKKKQVSSMNNDEEITLDSLVIYCENVFCKILMGFSFF